MPEAWYDAPTFYFTNPHAIIGPDDEVALPGCRAGLVTSSSRSPSSSAGRHLAAAASEAADTSSATRS